VRELRLKLKYIAILITTTVIIVGFAMISPLFFRINHAETKPNVMLSFSIAQSEGDVAGWCRDLANLLNSYQIGASVFLVGEIAEEYPDAAGYFSNQVDIGSQTYHNVDLIAITDYLLKLEEVKSGKMAVDGSGHVDSRVFRAPLGSTDQDIYSLLSRNGILADFSYENQYNVYQDGLFIKHDAVTYQSRVTSTESFSDISGVNKPIIIFFDNGQPIADIDSVISKLVKAKVNFVNASELTGFNLTVRGI
jgi:peptidoglycan/xylan/chitin deacetylase (PgdA/CDA1 family)